MPKYRPSQDDYFFICGATSLYGAFRPIEEKLLAGGYKGPVFADFHNEIYKNLEVVDKEATRKKQEEYDEEHPGSNKKVSPEYKKTDDHFIDLMGDADLADVGNIYTDTKLTMKKTLSKSGEKDYRKYLKKFENYLDLIIKNTPVDEYPEELNEIKFFKAYCRTSRVLGSREFLEDQMGFLMNTRGFDADHSAIKYSKKDKGISRELWNAVEKNYPYSDLRKAQTNLINLACDYEENKEKDTYIEQLKYRENYRKALRDYIDANKALAETPEESMRMLELARLDGAIKDLKQGDGPDKNVDYRAIYNRVKEQQERGEEVNPEEKIIFDDIKERMKGKEKTADIYNSRYRYELEAIGYSTNDDKDFTGLRGNGTMMHEVEAQINAIDMGWPADELIHIQRLQLTQRSFFTRHDSAFTPEEEQVLKDAKDFYNDRIKDKPYPATEEERQAFYRDFYKIASDITKITKSEFRNQNDEDESIEVEWTAFRDDIKKTMDKPLSFAEKLVLKHVQEEAEPEFSEKAVSDISELINKDRFGHSNSKEIERLQNAFKKFKEAVKENESAIFADIDLKGLSPENLQLLNELKDSAGAYLKDKDKEKKLPEERSEMGRQRYEGAQKAYHLADQLLKIYEAKLERDAKAKKEAERIKGRREAREAFFNADSKKGQASKRRDIYKAGSEEAYNAKIAAEEKAQADHLKKPVTDEEKAKDTDEKKYERFMNDCRTKKDDKVVEEDEVLNKEIQQRRVQDLGNMLAAIEQRDAGKPFDQKAINERATEIITLYSLDSLKLSTDALNGPETLKNALSFTFRAVDTKMHLEESLYEVGKVKYKNVNESQAKYQKDISELLNRKQPETMSEYSKSIIEALEEIKAINTEDKSLVGMNAYNMRKANMKLMKAINDTISSTARMDLDAYGPKLALDSLAVMNTYTGCKPVTAKLLQKLNAKVRDKDGNKLNINNVDFNKNFGVKHTKELAQKTGIRANARSNEQAGPQIGNRNPVEAAPHK